VTCAITILHVHPSIRTIVGIELGFQSICRTVLSLAHIIRDGRCLSEATHNGTGFLVVYQNDHPDADSAGLTEQRCAVYPAGTTFFGAIEIEVCGGGGKPADLCSDAAGAVSEGFGKGVANARGTADSVEEAGLQNTGDAEGRGYEKDAEGRRRPY
jgi:hypothetical protein